MLHKGSVLKLRDLALFKGFFCEKLEERAQTPAFLTKSRNPKFQRSVQ